MAPSYNFTWKENDEEDQKTRGNFWENEMVTKQVISTPLSINMGKSFIEKEMHLKIWRMKPRKDDVWCLTFPKSGTTMLTELLWQMSTGCDVKSEMSKKKDFIRIPYLEFSSYNIAEKLEAAGPKFTDEEKKELNLEELKELKNWEELVTMHKDSIQFAEDLPGPRILKSHLPISMLPPNLLDEAKVVYIARNPKDVCVSFYNMDLSVPFIGLRQDTSFDQYVDFFMSGKPAAYGNYWEHMKDCMKHKNHPNMKVIWYEDLVANFDEEVKGLSEFTGFELSDDQMAVLREHMKIDNMRKNIRFGKNNELSIARKGGAGGWKKYFTNESTLKKFDAWIQKNNVDEFGNAIEGLRFE